jgi:hypothetical protein
MQLIGNGRIPRTKEHKIDRQYLMEYDQARFEVRNSNEIHEILIIVVPIPAY